MAATPDTLCFTYEAAAAGDRLMTAFRPLTLVRRIEECLEPVVMNYWVRDIRRARSRRDFASDEDFGRYQALRASAAQTYTRAGRLRIDVPLHLWRAYDLDVMLGWLEQVLPSAQVTGATLERTRRADLGVRLQLTTHQSTGLEDIEPPTRLRMANGSGYEVECHINGYIPERALAYLTSNIQTGKIVNVQWVDEGFKQYYADGVERQQKKIDQLKARREAREAYRKLSAEQLVEA